MSREEQLTRGNAALGAEDGPPQPERAPDADPSPDPTDPRVVEPEESEDRSADDLAELKAKATERDELFEKWQRAKADYQNLQKRARKEREDWTRYAMQQFVADLLPVIDNLDRAIDSAENCSETGGLLPGIEMVRQHFLEVLGAHGVERKEAVGQPFDPVYHEAIAQAEVADQPAQTVLDEILPGYTLSGRVVRHSQVRVSRKPSGDGEPADGQSSEAPASGDSRESCHGGPDPSSD